VTPPGIGQDRLELRSHIITRPGGGSHALSGTPEYHKRGVVGTDYQVVDRGDSDCYLGRTTVGCVSMPILCMGAKDQLACLAMKYVSPGSLFPADGSSFVRVRPAPVDSSGPATSRMPASAGRDCAHRAFRAVFGYEGP
jgi:hypothetical protein